VHKKTSYFYEAILVAGTGLEPATFGLWAQSWPNFQPFYWATVM